MMRVVKTENNAAKVNSNANFESGYSEENQRSPKQDWPLEAD
ncbi:MAG TPA: hypothetical protein PKD78_08030 [Saprospiraceae bacterium]|nr:hypothetical protein [Saprospiraceae bacterium]